MSIVASSLPETVSQAEKLSVTVPLKKSPPALALVPRVFSKLDFQEFTELEKVAGEWILQ